MVKEENFPVPVGSENLENGSPDGAFSLRQGQITFNVKVYFDRDIGMTAEERLKRVIQAELAKKSS